MKKMIMASAFLLPIAACCIAVAACDTSGYVGVVTNEGPMDGACDSFNVYQLYDKRQGQVQAVPPVTIDSITKRLQDEWSFIKSRPTYKGLVAIHCYINCNGELMRATSWGRWGDPALRKEVESVFRTLTVWKPGKLYEQTVDCVEDFRVEFKSGTITVSSANLY